METRSRLSLRLAAAPPPLWLGIAATIIAAAIGTLIVYPLKSVAPAVSLGVVYIPGVILVSTIWGLRLGLATALLSALAFNWFHIPPVGHIAVADSRDVVALVVFAIVAATSSTLAELARARAAEALRGREEMAKALNELERLSAERERMEAEAIEAEAFRRSDELKTALLRSVSHDLRTPLTSMITTGAALGSPSATPEERRDLSDAVVQQGRRLSRLVENLLDVSRLESGKAEPHRGRVEVAEMLEAAKRSVGPGQEKVRLAIDEELPPLSADGAQLERAFANLLENGVRHGDGNPVLVRSRQIGPQVVVRVVDQGPGIPEPDRQHIFEPFYSTGSADSGGVGLGLAIAKGFIEANGGEIGVESVPGQGSTFVVAFPVGGGA
jgi:two-component system, OmpR family, sensor histidine kinase KdpD